MKPQMTWFTGFWSHMILYYAWHVKSFKMSNWENMKPSTKGKHETQQGRLNEKTLFFQVLQLAYIGTHGKT